MKRQRSPRLIVGGLLALAAIGIRMSGFAAAPEAFASQLPVATSEGEQHRQLLDRYCVSCHNQRLKTAGLTLDTLAVENLAADAATWEKVVRKLRSRAMPPVGRPRPSDREADALAGWLETALDRAAATAPNPGRTTVHRLNRAEYVNAIRDLLALEVDGRALLPADNSAHGFDNVSDVLSVSPGLLDRYLAAAWKISRLAIGDPTTPSTVETYRVSPLLAQDGRMSDDFPFGSRGGVALQHRFPLDGEYLLRVRLQRNYVTDNIRGFRERQQIDVRIDGKRVELFTIGGPDVKAPEPSPRSEPPARTADQALEVRFPVKAGTRRVVVTFVETPSLTEGLRPARYPIASFAHVTDDASPMAVDHVQIGGPLSLAGPGDTPSRRRLFTCHPEAGRAEESCARQIAGQLARRAYRRTVTGDELDKLMGFFQSGRREGSFDNGVQWMLERLLVDPNFLFRIERDPPNAGPGKPYQLGDFELASRLSFFLWSSIPDDELLGLAERGQLGEAGTLERQVRRMLADARSDALVANFAGQWLFLRNLRGVAPDSTIFPEFDDNLRDALQQETELFLKDQLREDRSVRELLTANYTFLNERLARHYEVPNVHGSQFRRVTMADDRRSGLLGHGSVLTVTSYAHRTSPVLRGKWLLENFLGAPPPPPPPDVPALKENDKGVTPSSVRERLEAHRRNPACAACHATMDPLGFALENFDATGRWRTTGEGGTAIDSAGALPDGTAFTGPAELRQVLVRRFPEFVTTMTEKLLTYALGRSLEHFDAPTVRQIVRNSADSDYRWSSLILGIVGSTPFQLRSAREP